MGMEKLSRGATRSSWIPYDGASTGRGAPVGYDPNNANDVGIRRNLGYALSYARRMNLAAMVPHGELSSLGYALASPVASGAEYLVYAPSGGTFTVDLRGTPGALQVEWFNPSNGSTVVGAAVNGGATRSFSAPFGGDSVLYLSQTTSLPATATPTRTPTPTAETVTPAPTGTDVFVSTVTATPAATNTPTSTATAAPLLSFPSTGVVDTFERPDGPLGSSWSGATAGYSIVGGRLDVGTSEDIYRNAVAFGPDQEAYVTFTAIDPNGTELGLILKAQSTSGWGPGLIEVFYAPTSKTIQVWTYHSTQGWLQRGASLSVALQNGDLFGPRARSNGQVEVYRNSALLATRDLTGWSYYGGGGGIGLFMLNASNTVLDDFGGGTIGSIIPTFTPVPPTVTATFTPSPAPATNTPTPTPAPSPQFECYSSASVKAGFSPNRRDPTPSIRAWWLQRLPILAGSLRAGLAMSTARKIRFHSSSHSSDHHCPLSAACDTASTSHRSVYTVVAQHGEWWLCWRH